MRSVFLFLGAVMVASAALATTKIEVKDIVDHPFSADFAPGGKLRLHVRSGDIHVLGTDQNRISVEISGKKAHQAHDMRVSLKEKDGVTELHVSGGPKNDLTITIRIPRSTDLYARIPGGDVRVEDVSGNKDISLHGGELTVAVGNSADYSHVDASIVVGELDAAPFGEEHGGFFRSVHKEGPGKYRLHAHVGAGQLTLQ